MVEAPVYKDFDELFLRECELTRGVTRRQVRELLAQAEFSPKEGISISDWVVTPRRFFGKRKKLTRLWPIPWHGSAYGKLVGPNWALDEQGVLYVRLFLGGWRQFNLESPDRFDFPGFPLDNLQRQLAA